MSIFAPIQVRSFFSHQLNRRIAQSTTRFNSRFERNMSDHSMHSAIINTWGEAPSYTQIPTPTPTDDEISIRVIGSGLHSVVRSISSGNHYASGTLPQIPGVDGVGHRIPDDKLVYFGSFPGGAFQDVVNVPSRKVAAIPDGVDPIQVAGYMNPAMSSWMALTARTTNLPENFTVLIMGATSASGRVAVEVARALGAGRVIGMARNAEALIETDVDQAIILENDVHTTDCSAAAEADVILDYLYGPVAAHLLTTVKFTRPVQYVHIGGLAGTETVLPGSILRSQNLTIRGSGPGSWSLEAQRAEIPKILNAFKTFKKQPVKAVPLIEVEQHWHNRNARIVFTP